MMDHHIFRALWHDDAGATAIEYGLIVALIAIAMVAALQSAGGSLSNTMAKADAGMASA
jgi:pilus assembly protein Flp/PilA